MVAEPPMHSSATSRRVRVLLVDDHPLFRAGVRQRLAGSSPAIEVVGEAGDGREAVDLVGSLQPDVVVMDISMPGMNGIEATRVIKRQHPHVAVLILTAYNDSQYVASLLEAGAAGYLLKTVEIAALSRAILDVVHGESVLDPAVSRALLSPFTRAKDDAPLRSSPLSAREMEVLLLAAAGASNKQIAEQLTVSVRTVHAHMAHILAKLSVGSRTEAVVRGLQCGWLDLDDLP